MPACRRVVVRPARDVANSAYGREHGARPEDRGYEWAARRDDDEEISE